MICNIIMSERKQQPSVSCNFHYLSETPKFQLGTKRSQKMLLKAKLLMLKTPGFVHDHALDIGFYIILKPVKVLSCHLQFYYESESSKYKA